MLDCVVGEDDFVAGVAGVADGTGGAGYLTDLGLETSGLGWDCPSEMLEVKGPVEDSGWAEGSAGSLQEAARFLGLSAEHLLSARTVNS